MAGWRRKSFILGFTLSLTSLALLALAYGLSVHFGPRDSTLSQAFYENELLFPVFSLDSKPNGASTDAVLRPENGMAASVFAVLWMMAVWGVVASAGALEERDSWIGLGVLSLSMVLVVAAVFHLRAVSQRQFDAIRNFITFRMVIQAKGNAEKLVRARTSITSGNSKPLGANNRNNSGEQEEGTKELEDGKADSLEAGGNFSRLISASEAARNLRSAEDALCACWDMKPEVNESVPSNNSLDEAYARVHACHEELSQAYLNEHLTRVAMLLFIVSSAKALKSQREIALRSLMNDLEHSLGFKIQPSSDPAAELANQTELCQKIRAFLEKRKREELEREREERLAAERELQRQERQRQAEAEAQRRREERERKRKQLEEIRRKREEERRRQEGPKEGHCRWSCRRGAERQAEAREQKQSKRKKNAEEWRKTNLN